MRPFVDQQQSTSTSNRKKKPVTPLSIEAIDHHLSALTLQGTSANTVKAYRSDLLSLLEYSQMQPSHQSLDPEFLAAGWLTSFRATLAPATTKRRLAAVRSLMRSNGNPNFLMNYRAPSIGKPEPHPLPGGMADTFAMLRVTRTAQERALVALCGLAALRVGEACGQRTTGLNRTERTLTVLGKGSKLRTIPLRPDAYKILSEYPGPLFVGGMAERQASKIITRLGQVAKVARPVSTHDLRATFATAMYRETKDLRAVQEYLGHSSIVTTQVYTGISMADMRKAATAAI